jgi:hypothetical protein
VQGFLPDLLLRWRRWWGLRPEHYLLWWKAVSRSPWSNFCCWIVDTSGVQPGFQQWSLWSTNTEDLISGHRRSANIMLIPETAAYLEDVDSLTIINISSFELSFLFVVFLPKSKRTAAGPHYRGRSRVQRTGESRYCGTHQNFMSTSCLTDDVKVEKCVFARTCWLLNKLW